MGRIRGFFRKVATRKRTSLPRDSSISVPENLFETAMVEKRTIIRTASRSSTTRRPNTRVAYLSFLSPRSSYAFIIMVVELIDSIPPRKMHSIFVHSITVPSV